MLNLLLFIFSCGVVRDGFSNQRKNNSDEFLVEKKKPLVMPPNYNQLPLPKNSQEEIKTQENSIKSLLFEKNNSDAKNKIDNINNNLEKSLLKKIQKN